MAMENGSTRADRCGTCKFYDPRATVCRRNPPKVFPMPTPAGTAAAALWPPVDALREWCGEYLLDPLVQDERGRS